MSSLRIVACGDVALCGRIEAMILSGRKDDVARGLRPIFQGVDLFLANVECPITDSGRPAWDYFKTLKAAKKTSRILSDLGISVASLANNHIADFGKRGLEDTIDSLKQQGIAWVGAGFSKEEAERPIIVETKGTRIGILALAQPEISAARNGGWGAGVLSENAAVGTVRSLKKEVDLVIAYLHFGVEFFKYPTPHQVRLCRSLVDAGAGLVLGHHPHVVQGFEYYKDGFIAYSLGNFIFDMNSGNHKFDDLGILVQVEVEEGRPKNVDILPLRIKEGNPYLLEDKNQEEAGEYLKEISSVLINAEDLMRHYYLTCRGNFRIHVQAFLFYGIRRMSWRRIRDNFKIQFWPQILQLRKDLLRFLISGDALRYENNRPSLEVGAEGRFWRWICLILKVVGLGWGRHLQVSHWKS